MGRAWKLLKRTCAYKNLVKLQLGISKSEKNEHKIAFEKLFFKQPFDIQRASCSHYK